MTNNQGKPQVFLPPIIIHEAERGTGEHIVPPVPVSGLYEQIVSEKKARRNRRLMTMTTVFSLSVGGAVAIVVGNHDSPIAATSATGIEGLPTTAPITTDALVITEPPTTISIETVATTAPETTPPTEETRPTPVMTTVVVEIPTTTESSLVVDTVPNVNDTEPTEVSASPEDDSALSPEACAILGGTLFRFPPFEAANPVTVYSKWRDEGLSGDERDAALETTVLADFHVVKVSTDWDECVPTAETVRKYLNEAPPTT